MRSITIQVETPEDEDRIAEFIIDAIAEYMRNKGLDLKYINDIKLQKLAYRVADTLDIPLTRSWYMRGCYVHNHLIDRDFLREKMELI